ncbi:MAG: type II 3-dehydroquinate dehydratase [Desulfohalobiaceae bacterium]
MQHFKFLVLNGPNLGALGIRQPEIYGTRSMQDLRQMLHDLAPSLAPRLELEFYQDNSEGGLIDRMESSRNQGCQGLVLNAGAYTHTSLALADCLAWIGLPCVEVHLSNVWARQEEIRHQSLIAPVCIGVVSGFGLRSYALAILALAEHVQDGKGLD